MFLREGDEVRMRSCVGHRVVDTARLRMRRGQGVAGLVFLTGQPAKVDNYLDDRTISQDFMFLAVQEETQSALAVPLRLQGELVGVLEVWRRRPSLFTERDVRRMVTFADVASIAIDNARLHDEQAAAVREMEQAGEALRRQVAVLDRSSRLQQTLLMTVRDGGGLPAIARTVGGELHCQVGIYDTQGCPRRLARGPQPHCRPARHRPVRHPSRTNHRAGTGGLDPAVHADGDRIGWVLLRPDGDSAEIMDVVAGQVAMACSLALLQAARREPGPVRGAGSGAVGPAAGSGRAPYRRAYSGPAAQRPARGSTARPLRPAGERRGARRGARLGHLADRPRPAGRGTSGARPRRRAGHCRWQACAGDFVVVVVVRSRPAPTVKDLVVRMAAGVRDDAGGLRTDLGRQPPARRRGRTAQRPERGTDGARRPRTGSAGRTCSCTRSSASCACLLGSGDDPDLLTFIDEVTGPLLAYDRENDGSLIRTLRAFFDADCSQRVAAERLFVHHKTLRYRWSGSSS